MTKMEVHQNELRCAENLYFFACCYLYSQLTFVLPFTFYPISQIVSLLMVSAGKSKSPFCFLSQAFFRIPVTWIFTLLLGTWVQSLGWGKLISTQFTLLPPWGSISCVNHFSCCCDTITHLFSQVICACVCMNSMCMYVFSHTQNCNV